MRRLRLLVCAAAWLSAFPLALADEAQAASEAAAPALLPGAASSLHIQVNLPARELRVIEHDTVVATYPVAIGALGFKSPVFTENITQLIWNPSWIPPDSPWAAGATPAPPGPNNPLGPVKMPLADGYRIHGTNKPNSIGRAASHGCFRMRNDDAAALAWYIQERMTTQTDAHFRDTYAKNRYRTYTVNLGAPVPVIVQYQPVEIRGTTITLHQDVYGRVRNWRTLIEEALAASGHEHSLVTDARVKELLQQLKKGSVQLAISELFMTPVAATGSPLQS